MAATCHRKIVTSAVAVSVAAAAKVATDASTALIVPESLLLKQGMKEADCGTFPVRSLDQALGVMALRRRIECIVLICCLIYYKK